MSTVQVLKPAAWLRAMEVARATFPNDNPYGVFAFGIGPRIEKGHLREEELTLNVYVMRKHSTPARAVPTLDLEVDGTSFSLAPNVIATGRRPRAGDGMVLPFTGLYPGAGVRVDGPPKGYGGLGCFIAPAGHGNPTHFLTAGHLFPQGAAGATVTAGDGASPPAVVGTLEVNLLDTVGIDAAAVRLTPVGLSLARASNDGPPIANVVPEASCFGKPATVFRPTTHDFSSSTTTSVGPTDAFLAADPRGSYWVRSVIATQAAITDEGDSGSMLCTGTHAEFGLAICVGEYHAQAVCEPLGRVLRNLQSTIPNVTLFPITP